MKNELVSTCFTDSGMEGELTTYHTLLNHAVMGLETNCYKIGGKVEIFKYKITGMGEIPMQMDTEGGWGADEDGDYSNARKYDEDISPWRGLS
jgi:hypothetical protein